MRTLLPLVFACLMLASSAHAQNLTTFSAGAGAVDGRGGLGIGYHLAVDRDIVQLPAAIYPLSLPERWVIELGVFAQTGERASWTGGSRATLRWEPAPDTWVVRPYFVGSVGAYAGDLAGDGETQLGFGYSNGIGLEIPLRDVRPLGMRAFSVEIQALSVLPDGGGIPVSLTYSF